MTICRCGHLKHAHDHYRRGNDCALCHCPRYRWRWLARKKRWQYR